MQFFLNLPQEKRASDQKTGLNYTMSNDIDAMSNLKN